MFFVKPQFYCKSLNQVLQLLADSLFHLVSFQFICSPKYLAKVQDLAFDFSLDSYKSNLLIWI